MKKIAILVLVFIVLVPISLSLWTAKKLESNYTSANESLTEITKRLVTKGEDESKFALLSVISMEYSLTIFEGSTLIIRVADMDNAVSEFGAESRLSAEDIVVILSNPSWKWIELELSNIDMPSWIETSYTIWSNLGFVENFDKVISDRIGIVR